MNAQQSPAELQPVLSDLIPALERAAQKMTFLFHELEEFQTIRQIGAAGLPELFARFDGPDHQQAGWLIPLIGTIARESGNQVLVTGTVDFENGCARLNPDDVRACYARWGREHGYLPAISEAA